MEVGEAALSRDLVDTELDLSESLLLVLVEVREGELKDSTLEGVGRVLESLGSVGKGLSDVLDLEHRGSLDVEPICGTAEQESEGSGRGRRRRAMKKSVGRRAMGQQLVPAAATVDGRKDRLTLSGEGVDDLLLDTFLAFRKTLVL